MTAKQTTLVGLSCLLITQIFFQFGFDFLQAQQPIDFAHWFMLIGALLLYRIHEVFPKGIINTISTTMVLAGIAAHIGMCTIDFLLWSYGDDHDTRNAILGQIFNTPSINLPFLAVGPAMLYAGIATHSLAFFKKNTIGTILTYAGTAAIGIGQMMLHNKAVVLVGWIFMIAGMIQLMYRTKA